MPDITILGLLAVFTLIGLGLSFFGFELAEPLLRWAGSLLGAGIGAVVGFGVLPEVIDETAVETLAAAGLVGLLIGAFLGYYFIPFVGRIAASIAAFVAATGATIMVIAGDETIEATLDALPEEPLANPLVTVDALLGTPMEKIIGLGEPLFIAVVVGIVGGGLAFRYYTDIIALAATVSGAIIMGAAVPIWILVLDGDQAFDLAEAEFSLLWFGAILVLGAAFQLFRHFEALDPRS